MTKPKSPNREQLPATRKPARIERLDVPQIEETREKRTLIVHRHTWNWAFIILAFAALVKAVAGVF